MGFPAGWEAPPPPSGARLAQSWECFGASAAARWAPLGAFWAALGLPGGLAGAGMPTPLTLLPLAEAVPEIEAYAEKARGN